MLEFTQNNRLNSLAKRMQQGDRQAAAEIFDHFNPLIFRFFVGRLLNRDVAEDLAQEVFLKVIHKIDTYQESVGNFSAWIWQIAKNRLIDYYREKKTVPLHDFLTEHPDIAQDDRHILNNRLETENILRLMKNFSPEEQEIFSFHYISEFSYKEMGRITGKSEGSLRVMIHRLNSKLKRLIKK